MLLPKPPSADVVRELLRPEFLRKFISLKMMDVCCRRRRSWCPPLAPTGSNSGCLLRFTQNYVIHTMLPTEPMP